MKYDNLSFVLNKLSQPLLETIRNCILFGLIVTYTNTCIHFFKFILSFSMTRYLFSPYQQQTYDHTPHLSGITRRLGHQMFTTSCIVCTVPTLACHHHCIDDTVTDIIAILFLSVVICFHIFDFQVEEYCPQKRQLGKLPLKCFLV